MTLARRTHWIGVFLLFTSSILLLVTTISAPIWNNVGLLKVHLNNHTTTHNSTISFGTFGYCVLRAGPLENAPDWCTDRHIGYEPAHVIAAADRTQISDIAEGTSDSLTRVMVLHPIACGTAFIAWLVSIGAGVLGSLVSAIVAFVAWIFVLIVLATDFSLFGILRHHVNGDKSGSHAEFGNGIWCLVVAFVLPFLAILIVTFTGFSARREKRAAGMPKTETPQETPRKKRFGIV